MKTGRRRLLNAALTKRLCEILEKGNTVRTATAACGIAESTYFSWIQRGEAGEPEFMEFSQACASAKATAKQMLTDIIVAAAPRDPKMACWLLEKLYPGEYGDGAHPDQPPEPPLLPPLLIELPRLIDELKDGKAERVAMRQLKRGEREAMRLLKQVLKSPDILAEAERMGREQRLLDEVLKSKPEKG